MMVNIGLVVGFFTIQAILFKIFCHKKQKAVNKKKGLCMLKLRI